MHYFLSLIKKCHLLDLASVFLVAIAISAVLVSKFGFLEGNRPIDVSRVQAKSNNTFFIEAPSLRVDRFLPGLFQDNIYRKDFTDGSSRLAINGENFQWVDGVSSLTKEGQYFQNGEGIYFVAGNFPEKIIYQPNIHIRLNIMIALALLSCVALFRKSLVTLLRLLFSASPEKALFVGLFFTFLAMPLPAIFILPEQEISPLLENRPLAAFPLFREIPVTSWPQSFASYLKDNNAYRSVAIRNYFYLHEWLLYTPLGFGFRGTDNFLFAKELVRNHAIPLAKSKSLMRARAGHYAYHTFLSKMDIPYIVVIPPDKETMLIEKLPWWVGEVRNYTEGRKLYAILDKLNIKNFNLEKILSKHSPDELYNKIYDPHHWNANAVHHFYQEIASLLEKDVDFKYQPIKGDEYYIRYTEKASTPYGIPDMAVKMRNSDRSNLIARPYQIESYDVHAPPHCYPTIVTNQDVDSGTMVHIGDSYTQDLSVVHISFVDNINMGIYTQNYSPVLPFAYNVRDWIRLYITRVNLVVLAEVVEKSKPSIVIFAPCERGYANFDNHTALIGERALGNLKIDFFTAFSKSSISGFSNDLTEMGDAKHSGVFLDALPADAVLKFGNVVTNEEGYVVVGGRVHGDVSDTFTLSYADADNKVEKLTAPVAPGDNYLYFQIFAEPNSEYDITLYPGTQPATFEFRPISYIEN